MAKKNNVSYVLKTGIMIGIICSVIALVGCKKKTTEGGPAGGKETTGQPSGGGEGETIKLGAFFAISGSQAPLGTAERDTVTMLKDKLNEAGGINGKKIEVVIYDSEGSQDKAILFVKKLIEEDKVLAIIGGTTSGETIPVIPTIEKAEIPFISCAASVKIVVPVNKWVFKTPQSDLLAVQKILEHIKAATPDKTKLGIINADNPFGTGGLAQFQEQAPAAGFEIVSEKSFNNEQDNAKTLAPVLQEMVGAGAQVIICWGTNPGPAHVTIAWQDTGLKDQGIPLYQSHGVANREYIETAENISNGSTNGVLLPAGKLIIAEELDDSDPQKPLLLEYAKEFRTKYGKDANTFGGHAWDAFNLMVNAIKQVGTDKAKIRDAIENTTNFSGTGGVFNFSPTEHNGLDISAFVMVTVQDGKWTLVR